MKLKNIFKKEVKAEIKTNVQKLDKNQLEKVIGGTDEQTGKVTVRGWDPVKK